MSRARNLGELLASDGQVEDSKIDGVASTKLTGTIPDARFSTARQASKLPLTGGAMSGAITTTSTFDGRDVATDGTKLDAIEASATADQTNAEIRTAVEAATSIALGGSPTTTTQSASDNSTKVATTAYADAAVGVLTSGASATHDTLLEIQNLMATDAELSSAISGLNHDSLAGFVAAEHLDWAADQGATNLHAGNYTNTTYSVGDGGLSQINFTSADNTKLDGIETSAKDDQTAAEITALGIAATSVTGAQASAITANTAKTGISAGQTSAITANTAKVTNYNQTKSDIEALGILASSITGALPAIDGSNLTGIDAVVTGTTLTSPVPAKGSLFYKTDTDVLYISNGTQWGLVSNAVPATTGGTVTIAGINELVGFSYNLGIDFADDVDTDAQLTYTLESGSLPLGCVLPSVGNTAFTGTASEISSTTTYTFTIKATDTSGGTATQNYQQTITNVPFVATGGTITTISGYKIHTFTSSGTFTPNKTGTVEYLVVAGGGGGGGFIGGGGGAGGLLTASSFSVTSSAHTVTIGAGGSGRNGFDGNGTVGNHSVFGSITAISGGFGGGGVGGNGGSGGGGGHDGGAQPGSGTVGQGNDGGWNGSRQSPGYPGGGGGGAGSVGGNPPNTSTGGNGGSGSASSINGSSVYRAGGGGGSTYSVGANPGTGGSGGGGAGGRINGSGTTNTGGGGGAADTGNGGSGTVIIRYAV